MLANINIDVNSSEGFNTQMVGTILRAPGCFTLPLGAGSKTSLRSFSYSWTLGILLALPIYMVLNTPISDKPLALNRSPCNLTTRHDVHFTDAQDSLKTLTHTRNLCWSQKLNPGFWNPSTVVLIKQVTPSHSVNWTLCVPYGAINIKI